MYVFIVTHPSAACSSSSPKNVAKSPAVALVTLFPRDAVRSVGVWSVLAGLAPISVHTVRVAFLPVMPYVVVAETLKVYVVAGVSRAGEGVRGGC